MTKRKLSKIILLFWTILVLLVYIVTDSKLYFQGKSDIKNFNKLPLNIVPQYDDYDIRAICFILEDKSGMSIIGYGCRYWSSDVEIRKVIKYGYNDEKLLALINDSLGDEYWVQCEENMESKSEEPNVQVLPKGTKVDESGYTWVVIDDKDYNDLIILRNRMKILFYCLFFICLIVMTTSKPARHFLKEHYL